MIPKRGFFFGNIDEQNKKMYKKWHVKGRFYCTYILKWLCILFSGRKVAERVANDFKSNSPKHN